MVACDHVHADIAGVADNVADDRAVDNLEPARPLRFAHHDVRDVIGAGISEHILRDIIAAWKRDCLALQLLGKAQRIGDAVALDLGQMLALVQFDIERRPRRVQPVGKPLRVTYKAGRARVLADANEQALARGPGAGDGMRAHMGEKLLVHPLRRTPKRKFAQRRQITGREIMVERALGLLRDVDLAFFQPLDQLVRRKVDDFDVVRLVEKGIRHGLADADAGDLRDDIVQAFDMLNVERGVNVDAGGEQLFHIEIALGMAAAWRVGVRKLVHERDLRVPLEEGIQVHLFKHMPVIVYLRPRNGLETFEQRLRFGPPMGFDHADRDVGALGLLALGRQQHLIGFADPRRRA